MRTKIFTMFAIISFMVCGLSAQNRQQSTPEERATRQTKTLTEKLKLSDEQKDKVYEITLKYAKQRSSQSDSETSREKRMEAFQKLQKEQDKELKAIFTDDQKKGYDKHQKETQNQRNNNRRQRNR